MSRLENNRYAIGFQLTSRMSRQVLPPSTKPLHLPILPFPSVATVTYRRVAFRSDLQEAHSARCPTRGYLFWRVGPRMSLYVHRFWTMSTFWRRCPLFLSSFATRMCTGTHPRAHATGSHGVISMECLGRLGSKKSGRVSSCVCVHPREFSSSVAYPRTPLPSLPTSENSSWCTFLRVRNLRDRVLLSRLRLFESLRETTIN